MNRRAVITGMGVISPNGIGNDSFWEALRNGKSGIKRITSFDAAGYPCQAAGEVDNFNPLDYLDKKEAKRMVRISQFAMAATRMALKDAGYGSGLPANARCYVTLGVTTGLAVDPVEKEHKVLLSRGPHSLNPFTLPSSCPNAGVSEISNSLGVDVIQRNFSNDCTAGVDALGYTAEMIKKGEINIGICGGNECPVTPLEMALFCRSGLTPVWTGKPEEGKPEEISRPFDLKHTSGVISEGAAIFIFEELGQALRRHARIYGEIVGFGSSSGICLEEGLKKSMERAFQRARIPLSAVDYISAHGPSHCIIDKIETDAIKKLFGQDAYRIPVSSIKSMIGNPLAAAGTLQVAAALLTLKHGIIPPTINYQYPDPECDLDYVPNVARRNKVNLILINSHGLGGANTSLLLRNVVQE